jgi:hypothetical protein
MNAGPTGVCHLRRPYSRDHVCANTLGETDSISDDPSLVTCRDCRDENVYLDSARQLSVIRRGKKFR